MLRYFFCKILHQDSFVTDTTQLTEHMYHILNSLQMYKPTSTLPVVIKFFKMMQDSSSRFIRNGYYPIDRTHVPYFEQLVDVQANSHLACCYHVFQNDVNFSARSKYQTISDLSVHVLQNVLYADFFFFFASF